MLHSTFCWHREFLKLELRRLLLCYKVFRGFSFPVKSTEMIELSAILLFIRALFSLRNIGGVSAVLVST